MKASDDNLMNSSLRSIGRCELPLLQAAFHKQVVSLFAAEGGIRQIVVERQAVPICVVQLLPVFSCVSVRFAHPNVGDLHS